jgi:hypothetical protein
MLFRVELINPNMTDDEKISSLCLLIQNAGTSWLYEILKDNNITNRTKIVDTFRWYDYMKKDIRGQKARLKAAQQLLKFKPFEFWADAYIRNSSIRYFVKF